MRALLPPLLLGAAIRLGLLLHWPGRLNVDESVGALMGLHVLRGEFPAFMYSVAYQGTAETYATALLYAMAGASPITAKLAVFGFSCLLIVVAFLIGQRMAGRPGALLSALLTAVAPPFLPVMGNYPMLGYMEVVVVGSLALLVTLDLVTVEQPAAARARKMLLLGFVAGLGWWINPMTLSYLGAAGLVLTLSPRMWSTRALWGLPLAFLVGSLPFWLFNVRHAFWSFVLFRRGAEGEFREGALAVAPLLLDILGIRGILTGPVPFLSATAGVVYLALLAILVIDLRSGRDADGRVRRRGIQLLLLFAAGHCLAAALNRNSAFAADRYLFPLYSAIPILTAMALLRLGRWSRGLAVGAGALLLLNNTAALGKTVLVYEAGRRQDTWRPAPIVAFLEREGLTRAYADQRLAPRLTFAARERVVVVDYDNERYPPYRDAADAAPRVAYLAARSLEMTPERFELSLAGIGAAFRRQDFGDVSVFFDFRPRDATPLQSLSPAAWRAEAMSAGSDPARAFDRDAETGWLSGAPIVPGMWYRLDLGATRLVGGVSVLPIRWRHGAPRGYRVEVSADGTAWTPVVAVPAFSATLDWDRGQPRFERGGRIVCRFAPRPVRFVRVVQTGRPVADWWGISEIFVYGPAGETGARAAAELELREGLRRERAGRLAPALAAYGRAVALDPGWEAPHGRVLTVYSKAGLLPDGSDPDRRGQVFEALELWGKAVSEYERILAGPALDGQHSDPLRRLATLYRRDGRVDAAARVERVLEREYAPPVPAAARFGHAARLLGYDLAPPAPRAGDAVELSYYWQALAPMAEDFAVFVHLVRDGRIRFSQDHDLLHGLYTTRRWRPGERVRERYRITLPADLPAGDYELRLGLWNPRSGRRLPVDETRLPRAGAAVRLATVRIEPAR